MRDEEAIEQQLKESGKTAPRLSPTVIDSVIVSAQYHVFPGTTLTVCAITLKNGFVVIGESAAASTANFDKQMGEKIAYDKARDKIWALEGYLLREKLSK